MLPLKGVNQISLLPQGHAASHSSWKLNLTRVCFQEDQRPDPTCSMVTQVPAPLPDKGWEQTAGRGHDRLSPLVVSLSQLVETDCKTALYVYKTGKRRK